MKTLLRFLLLVGILNFVRYLLGWFPETCWVLPGRFGVMAKFPESFNNNFGGEDFSVPLVYNFMLWLATAWIFHLAHASVRGSFLMKTLKIYGICALFFASLAVVCMNHFVAAIRLFYLQSMLDALVLFPIVAAANGLLYPLVFTTTSARTGS